MNMLQRIVIAFGGRQQAEREARAEMPVVPEHYRSAPMAPGRNSPSDPDEHQPREASIDPSIAARRLWCSAGHF